MKGNSAKKIKLTSYDDLFGVSEQEVSGEAVTKVPISSFHAFKNHPFRVQDDEKMRETVDSIKKNGVLMPGIVRPYPEGGYEVIAGHRRWRACELAGITDCRGREARGDCNKPVHETEPGAYGVYHVLPGSKYQKGREHQGIPADSAV